MLHSDLQKARMGFRARFRKTPGVVVSGDDELPTSLVIQRTRLDIPYDVLCVLSQMYSCWETPNGDLITEATELARHLKELCLGFWYRWDPPAPRDWLNARRNWKSYVRETLAHNRRGLDTELQVWNECFRFHKEEEKLIKEWWDWLSIKDSFQINTVAEWISDFALEFCFQWLKRVQKDKKNPGICWVLHTEFGKKLSAYCAERKMNIPYFGAGDSRILSFTGSACIASIRAHSTGKNLQHFSKNLITSPIASGAGFEQLLGRTHRHGQKADTVSVDLLLPLPELEAIFEQARLDARYIEDTQGVRQKLNYASVVL